MTTTYQISPDELNRSDETTYLLSDSNRANRLETAAKNVRTNQNTVSLTFDQLQELEQRASI